MNDNGSNLTYTAGHDYHTPISVQIAAVTDATLLESSNGIMGFTGMTSADLKEDDGVTKAEDYHIAGIDTNAVIMVVLNTYTPGMFPLIL